MKTYYVACKIEGRFYAEVQANSLKEAENRAIEKYTNADFGELEDSNMDIIHIEDEKGNYNYPPYSST